MNTQAREVLLHQEFINSVEHLMKAYKALMSSCTGKRGDHQVTNSFLQQATAIFRYQLEESNLSVREKTLDLFNLIMVHTIRSLSNKEKYDKRK